MLTFVYFWFFLHSSRVKPVEYSQMYSYSYNQYYQQYQNYYAQWGYDQNTGSYSYSYPQYGYTQSTMQVTMIRQVCSLGFCHPLETWVILQDGIDKDGGLGFRKKMGKDGAT